MFAFHNLGSIIFEERINVLKMFRHFLHKNLPYVIFRDITGEILFSSVSDQELFYKMNQMVSKEYGDLSALGKLRYMDPCKIIYCINEIKCNNIIEIIVIRSENISNNQWRTTADWSLELFKNYYARLNEDLVDLVTVWIGHESYLYPIKYIPKDWPIINTNNFICKADY